MPLELKLKRGAVDQNLVYFLMLDNTGVYDAVDNPGGYGAPNPERAVLALYLYGYKHNKSSDDTPIIIDNTAPPTVTQWQIPMFTDGYYYFKLLGFNIYDELLAYVADDMVYYATKYYIATDIIPIGPGQDPLTNPTGSWTEVTDLTTEEVYNNASVHKTSSDQVVNYRAKACYQEQVFLDAEGCCDCHSREKTKTKTYQKIFVHLNAANFDCLQQKYAQADEELMFLSEYCKSIHCVHCKC